MNQTELQAMLNRQVGSRDIYNVVVGIRSRDGQINAAAAAGTANPATSAKMQADTPYFIASVTKMYTAAVILKLHEQGLLDLDKPISDYLPASMIDGIHIYKGVDYSAQIKVYQLVNQTSGLADYFEDKPKGGHSLFDELKQGHDRALDIQQVMDIVRNLPPKFEPGAQNGEKASYADTNYQLLGAIIESVTGRSIADNYRTMIFDPLRLKQTYAYDRSAAQSNRAPAVIYLEDRAVNLPEFFSTNTPDGGLVSTVSENLVFLRAFLEGKLFDPKFFDRMMGRWNAIFFPLQYGYGMMRFKLPWYFSPFKPMPELIGHSGSTGSFAYYCPARELYLTGTVNQIVGPNISFMLMIQIINALK